MTQDVRDAVVILERAWRDVASDDMSSNSVRQSWRRFIARAIRHLAYPDRDIYPKTRRATKGAPIVRR